MASISPIRIYVTILVLACLVGVIGSMAVEGLSPLDAVYYVIATIATVGYGDIAPKTPAGRALAIFLILAGVGSFVAVFANAIEILVGRSETRERRRKVSMIIGVFFSEFGTEMLGTLAGTDPDAGKIRSDLLVRSAWTDAEFGRVRESSRPMATGSTAAGSISRGSGGSSGRSAPSSSPSWRTRSSSRTTSFTNLLQAVFHLADELLRRGDLSATPPSDHAHLVTDTERVYKPLALLWLDSMEHLKEHHPYLFSLAMRTNPFDPEADVVVR